MPKVSRKSIARSSTVICHVFSVTPRFSRERCGRRGVSSTVRRSRAAIAFCLRTLLCDVCVRGTVFQVLYRIFPHHAAIDFFSRGEETEGRAKGKICRRPWCVTEQRFASSVYINMNKKCIHRVYPCSRFVFSL